jgi:hypothetical protein
MNSIKSFDGLKIYSLLYFQGKKYMIILAADSPSQNLLQYISQVSVFIYLLLRNRHENCALAKVNGLSNCLEV